MRALRVSVVVVAGLLAAPATAGATSMVATPTGHLDVVQAIPGGLFLSGWALDPDTANPIYVWINIAGAGFPLGSPYPRPDIAAAYPDHGPHHGFQAAIPTAPGTHRVCATAINHGPGQNTPLGCATVTVGGTPTGHLDQVYPIPGGLFLAGWALDPDTPNPTYVWIDIAGAGFPLGSPYPRPDIAAAYPGHGPHHGFQAAVPTAPGTHRVCATAINHGLGPHTPIGCRIVEVSHEPFGSLELAQGTGATNMSIAGWALDPDTIGAIDIYAYVDGVLTAIGLADEPRSDVGDAFPGYGAAHGFDLNVTSRRDQHICVYAVNRAGPGQNVLLGCRIDPTMGRPPPPGAPVPPYASAIRPVTESDYGNAWRPGCPVGPESLRHVTVGYWGFDGQRHDGGLVVHHAWAPHVADVFGRLYEARFQIERIQPITLYSGPGDDRPDHENITSAFICRPVTGGSAWSQHSYGWAVDINPVQNPYVNGPVVVPDPEGRDYLDRGQAAPAMIRPSDAVVQAFAGIGWGWGGTWSSLRDYMHFSATGS